VYFYYIRKFFLSVFFAWRLLTTCCKCRRLSLLLITLSDTYTVGRTPLDEESARHKALYSHNTQQSQQTNIQASGRIRKLNRSKQPNADPRLRPRGHWERVNGIYNGENLIFTGKFSLFQKNLCLTSRQIASQHRLVLLRAWNHYNKYINIITV
jgi:hypothetical protein